MRILTPLAVIAISIGMYFLYISPTAVEVKALTTKKAQYYDVLEKAKELNSKRDELTTSYNSISATDIERLNKVVPEALDPVILSNDLNSIAMQNRLKMGDFRTSTVENRQTLDSVDIVPYMITTVSVKLSGQYSDFLRFLESVESSLRLLDVVSLTIDSAPGSDSDKTKTGLLQFTLQMNVYSLK